MTEAYQPPKLDHLTNISNATLLIVDDTPQNLAVLGEILTPHFRVLVANSGARALALAQSAERLDLILLDVMMPEIDGHQVLARLKANPATRHVPVIFVTALDSTENEQIGLDLGAVDYITKPVRPAIVLARVKTQLVLKAAQDWLRNQNAWLEAEVAKRTAENHLIQQVAIHALARLAEIRDNETGNHILRTQAYVRVLAQHLQANPRFSAVLTSEYIELLAESAPLHDIGKVGIPDSILRKPGKLDTQEWEIMKTHTLLGYEALAQAEHDCAKPLSFLAVAKQIAVGHHERWDGSGYPYGLVGEAISVPARLMALADVFDALISKRVYKPAMPVAEARDYILSQRGHQFDPEVVDAFAACYDEFLTIAHRFSETAPAV